jgi:hypothetical protein
LLLLLLLLLSLELARPRLGLLALLLLARDILLEARRETPRFGCVRRVRHLAQVRAIQRDGARLIRELALALREVVQQRRLWELVVRRFECLGGGLVFTQVVLLGTALSEHARLLLVGVRDRREHEQTEQDCEYVAYHIPLRRLRTLTRRSIGRM